MAIGLQNPDATPSDRLVDSYGWKKSELAARYLGGQPEDNRTTPELCWQDAADLSGLSNIMRQIGDLSTADETDEFGILRPTFHALSTTLRVVVEASEAMIADADSDDVPCLFPRGSVTTDARGGLRIAWEGERRSVRLVVSAEESGKSYIYHEHGDQYGTSRRLTGRMLACWLQGLFR